ncbi:MAG: M50 family metallopeptidase [Anaerolineaceae bacterium]|nr:M50 family metallopeptidase [Anaerolineaceae bacterium]
MKIRDLLWFLVYPIYQLIGTFRHEASHAIMAILHGAKIEEFVFLPIFKQGERVAWGFVRWSGSTNWLTLAAPYFCDLITFGVFFWICYRVSFSRRWIWLNLVIIGMLSPVINSAYNYSGIFHGTNDVGRLAKALPGYSVHIYFIFTFILYIIGLVLVFRFSQTASDRA